MAHLDAGDVSDGVERTGRAADRQLEVALAGLLGVDGGGKSEGSNQHENG